jgi:hypothetical protein
MTKIQSKQIGDLYLSGLTDTNLTGLTNENIILYNSGTTKWEAVETINIEDTSLASKFSITTGFTQNVTLTITHNLDTEDIIVQGWDGLNVLTGLDIQLNTGDTSNKIDVTSSNSGTYKIVVMG